MAAERICGCDDRDDGRREKRGRSLLFMGAVGWNGPLKLACYAILVGLPSDPQRSAQIW
jgi:hypothetical protein